MQLQTKVLLTHSLLIIAMGVLFDAEAAVAEDAPGAASPPADTLRVLQTKMIWDAASHNAFTDLTRWKDRWYCSFREGSAHASYDGTVRILSSADGTDWQSVAQFAEKGRDLRVPKLCVLPDGRLLAGGPEASSIFAPHPTVVVGASRLGCRFEFRFGHTVRKILWCENPGVTL